MNLEAWRHYLRGVVLQRRKRPLQAMDELRAAMACDAGFARDDRAAPVKASPPTFRK
mgnify:CR=1 FL=1